MKEQGNVAKIVWPVLIGGIVYTGAAARSQKGFAPLAFGGLAAYGVLKAMDNQKDYIGIHFMGGEDVIPF